ncbi:hypothetical protein [Streptomyces sp. S1]|uniref:hypothetical protein n=1 Tax=Streptomyces sp. S1 TaxID=718288 RepID=UPI003D754A07
MKQYLSRGLEGATLDALTIADKAFGLQLGTTRRPVFVEMAGLLTDCVREHLAAPVEDGEDYELVLEEARGLLIAAPGRDALTYSIYTHMRALARIVRRLEYKEETSLPPVEHDRLAVHGGIA